MIRAYSNKAFCRPVLVTPGWWQRRSRVTYGQEKFFEDSTAYLLNKPVSISGVHAKLLGSICKDRYLNFQISDGIA
ncbi:hypothetical protein EOD41_03270 [Mucilaginibacter limnophilus]|uniref:Uncharacterized protein n=1 Tax=Mucilaginibacter limnophilus TaxID=1932778 RepID=A0A3S2V466_9SPHI|nr:hypothetical protein [Mucilaginibacter limnophilus]RVU02968.1 hypothetical protein EOD41_03270 [Mucilaginibacter limnophilus]